jgi:DNA-binding transcriptional LysR family regulator
MRHQGRADDAADECEMQGVQSHGHPPGKYGESDREDGSVAPRPYNLQFDFVLSLSRFFIGQAMDVDDRVLRRLKLSDLRLLRAVVKWGSMARAAAKLNISQPAVSKAIKSLELALGVRLLDRTPHGIEPTIYGSTLLKGGAAVFDELLQSVRQIRFLADPGAGQLHIGCTEAGAAGFVPAVIARLSQKYPRVVFRVTTGDAAAFIERHLPQREIDLAIGAMPDTTVPHDDIACEVLFEEHYCVMAGARSKWARRRKIALGELVDEPWVLPASDTTMGTHIGRAFRDMGLEPPRSRVMSFSVPLCQHLLAGSGFITIFPLMMTRLGKHLGLRPLDVELPGISRAIAIMTLEGRTLSPAADLFMSCARGMAKDLTEVATSRDQHPTRGADARKH